MEPDVFFQSLTAVAERIRASELSPVELTRALLERIERVDAKLHAYLLVLGDRALEQARTAEREIAEGGWRGPLHGVPVAVKDLCWTKGIRTTCASKVLADWRPEESAAVVDKLEAAGAVIVGKLNLTEFAMGWYHPTLPVPVNPWGAEFWAGASSSGSGVAAAAGLAFATIGSDTGGSIRFPSAANGVVGLKPTYGRVSRYGVFPLAESLDHVGPIVRAVADAAVVLDAIAGFDPRDPTSRREPAGKCAAEIGKGIRGVRVGFDEQYASTNSAPEVSAAVAVAVRALEELGATIVPVEMPPIAEGLDAWLSLCAADALAAHAEFFPSRADEYGAGFRSFLELAQRLSAADYARAHRARERFAGALTGVFENADVLACPSMPARTLPSEAIPPDARLLAADPSVLRFTAPFDLSRNPTLSLPCDASSPPVSLQLVGRHLEEPILCRVGHAYEQATDWHRRRPPNA